MNTAHDVPKNTHTMWYHSVDQSDIAFCFHVIVCKSEEVTTCYMPNCRKNY